MFQYLIFCFICVASLNAALSEEQTVGSGVLGGGIQQLLPGQHRKREVLHLDSETKVYSLGGLVPGRSYEIRVSHPAFIPASVIFQLGSTGGHSFSRRLGRRLLDCDKLIFKVAADGSVQGHPQPLLFLSASSSSIHKDGPGAGARVLLYNIVLQPLILGIPEDSLPVILVCLVLLLAVHLHLGHRAASRSQRLQASPGASSLGTEGYSVSRAPIKVNMDAANCEQACSLVSKSYVSQGQQALARRHRLVKTLLSSRRLPDHGWDEPTIEMFVQDCALMDSNNFLDNVGAGEREGRVACPLVARQRHHLAHGIGRSGDIAAEQPKAAGSSLLAKMATLLAADALHVAGLQDLGRVTVLPLATGMAMTMTLLAIKASRPREARFVVWSRIDQKTCLKAITAAGLDPVVVELQQRGDELCTNVDAMREAVERLGKDAVAAVVTTTSCFAPRASDDVVAVAHMCAEFGVPHMINNAYGIQSASICRDITAAWRKGRVDAFVSSTDKNFMVPVGGALVAEGAKLPGMVEAVNKAYPGRASVTAHLDLLMTLLHWGAQGWRKVLQEREELYPHMKRVLEGVASRRGQRVLNTPGNPISLAMTLDQGALQRLSDHTFIGSMLWARCVSGTRVVPRDKRQIVAGIAFSGYGSHSTAYPHVYMTAAAAIGGTSAETDLFGKRVDKCLQEVEAKEAKKRMVDDEDDVVIRELDVYLASDTAGAQLGLLSCPLRPPWRKYPYEDVEAVRMKPHARRLEMDVPLDQTSANYAGDEAHHARGVDKVTLRSSPVEAKTSMAIGILQDGAFVLAPLEYCLQLRPHLGYLNKKGKEGEEGGEEGGGGEEEEEGEEPALRAVEVQVQKRETERQLQARINSYAYISQKEEEEAWKELKVHLQESEVACRLWDRLMAPSMDADPAKSARERDYLNRLEYLHTFVPAIGGTAVGSEVVATGSKANSGGTSSTPPDRAGSAEGVSDAARNAFPNAMKALFSQHSVCSMANVRQWLQDPKGAGTSAAREAATLTDQALHSMVVDMSGLPLACIRRMYVLKACGKPEQDGLRRIVVELLQDKESLKRQDILTAANQQNLPVTDALYNKVVKDLCISRNQAWMLKFGADMP